jgi:hypothetical protein
MGLSIIFMNSYSKADFIKNLTTIRLLYIFNIFLIKIIHKFNNKSRELLLLKLNFRIQ